ncbi:MAG TPA: DUF6600 domain-containing protein, partial [Vicinamibacterales bacterium]|nr:DUF6600 domain-containing protein [Vicinamibacterales bacterium]
MRTLIPLVLFGLLAGPAPLFAQSSEYGIPAHVSRVDGRALLEREGGGEDLERNLTLTEGDRIRTQSGRVEILFADGTLLHLDRHTIVDFQREDFLRVMEGRARWYVAREATTPRATRAAGNILRVDTPAATLELDPGGDYRVAVAPNGDAELAVLRGSGALLNDQGDTALRAGERAVAAMGHAPSQAFYANAASWDDFDRWSDGQRRAHATAISARYLPNELRAYGSVFDSYGSWRSHAEYGYVWYPVAASGWQPYSHGRWHSYPRYGWTWIGRDAWAWPTHHFGRWGFSAGVWFWIPGRSWGPAWVAWASSPGYVGWSPLGRNDHPIYRVNVYNSYSSGYPWCGWTFIRERHFGGRSWSAGDIFIGTSVAVVARGGITPSATSPAGRRAIPRNGVASGTAIPRGGSGLSGSSGPAEGGLAGVPSARPRRIPTGTISSTGSTRSTGSMGSMGSTDGRTPRQGSGATTGTSAQPRVRSGSAPAQNRPASEPRATEDRPAAGARTTPAAGRPVRQAPAAGARDDAGPGRAQPRVRQDDAPAPAPARSA